MCRPKRIGCCPLSSVIVLVLRAGLGNSECHRRSNSCIVRIIDFYVVPSEPICVQMANTRKLRHLLYSVMVSPYNEGNIGEEHYSEDVMCAKFVSWHAAPFGFSRLDNGHKNHPTVYHI